MEGKINDSPRKKALRHAKKTFKFWYNVLLETEYMNDAANRREFQSALATIKDEYKNTKNTKSLT